MKQNGLSSLSKNVNFPHRFSLSPLFKVHSVPVFSALETGVDKIL